MRAADALIAVGGEYGTLSEIALALKAGKPVVGLGSWELPTAASSRPGASAARAAAVDAVRARGLQPRLDSPVAERQPYRSADSRSRPSSARRPTSTRCAATRSAIPGRFHVPGHKGGPGADPGLREAIGERAFAMDVPSLT